MGVAENVAAWKHVIDLLSLREMDDDLFWVKMLEHVQAIVDQRLPPVVIESPNGPMRDDEAIEFESALMPFGKFVGVPVGEVPADYLLAITDSKFNRRMLRYVACPRFAARQEESDGE